MEGEHTPTIIQLIRSTDLAVIQFKDSHIFFIFPTKDSSSNPSRIKQVYLRYSSRYINLKPNELYAPCVNV